jgi:pyruvate dehydrogenase E1 component alpha subunit
VDVLADLPLVPDLEPVRLLEPDGSPHAPHQPGRELAGRLDEIDASTQLSLHEHLVVTRAVDRELVHLQRQGQLALYPSCLGQEAAQVGTAAALEPGDWVFPSYRELGVALVRGIPADVWGRTWRGDWHGWHDPLDTHFGLVSVPIGTSSLHAVGVGMGIRRSGGSDVVATYFGDGATSAGDTHEALNFAGVYQAPVLFICQNNQWAISVPVAQQTAAPSLAHKAVGYGMPGVRVDGNDVLACYALTRRLAARARLGRGPGFVEAVTYRMESHTTSDDARRYRHEREVADWAAADPLERMRLHLQRNGLWSDDYAQRVTDRAARVVADLRRALVDAPAPDPAELFDNVYVDPPPRLTRQRTQLLAELAAQEGYDVDTP